MSDQRLAADIKAILSLSIQSSLGRQVADCLANRRPIEIDADTIADDLLTDGLLDITHRYRPAYTSAFHKVQDW